MKIFCKKISRRGRKNLKQMEERCREDGGNISRRWRKTAVKPGIYGLAFTMGKKFLTENSAMVGGS